MSTPESANATFSDTRQFIMFLDRKTFAEAVQSCETVKGFTIARVDQLAVHEFIVSMLQTLTDNEESSVFIGSSLSPNVGFLAFFLSRVERFRRQGRCQN